MSAQVIGYLGENGVRDVRIPIGHLIEKWPGLHPALVMVPVGGMDDDAYPVDYELDGTDLVWHVSGADTAVTGTTKAAVRMVGDDGRIGLDEPFEVYISANLSAGGTAPDPLDPWIDRLIVLVSDAEAAADYAAEMADDANAAAQRAENAAQNWESGTANNALNLGDKPPEYYLPAVQLLVNPDFAVAQPGYNVMLGNEYFCADRWNGSNNEISLHRNAGYITLTSTADYRQIYQKVLVSDLVADAYTFAVKRRSASVSSSLFLYGENANGNATNIKSVSMGTGGEWQTFVLNFTRANVAQYTKIWCCIRNQAAGVVDYKEPVLYPGIYTAKTLPPFAPPDTTLELVKCQKYLVPISIGGVYNGLIGSTGNVNIGVPTPFMTGARSVAGGENLQFVIVTSAGVFGATNFTVAKYDDTATRIISADIASAAHYNMPFTAYTQSTSGDGFIEASI